MSKSDAGKFKDEVVRNMQILEGLQYAMLAVGCLILLAVLIFVIVYKVRSARDSEVRAAPFNYALVHSFKKNMGQAVIREHMLINNYD